MLTVYQTQRWCHESSAFGTIVVSVYGSLTGLDPIDDKCVIGLVFAPIAWVRLKRSPSPQSVCSEYGNGATNGCIMMLIITCRSDRIDVDDYDACRLA
jgi:hypothetical protein